MRAPQPYLRSEPTINAAPLIVDVFRRRLTEPPDPAPRSHAEFVADMRGRRLSKLTTELLDRLERAI